MEEFSYPLETPYFGPNKHTNLSELDRRPEPIEEEKTNKKEKRKKHKVKTNKSSDSEKLPPLTLNFETDPYHELLTKKIKLRNDFDKKHVEKLLAEAEEAFEECDLDDKISGDES